MHPGTVLNFKNLLLAPPSNMLQLYHNSHERAVQLLITHRSAICTGIGGSRCIVPSTVPGYRTISKVVPAGEQNPFERGRRQARVGTTLSSFSGSEEPSFAGACVGSLLIEEPASCRSSGWNFQSVSCALSHDSMRDFTAALLVPERGFIGFFHCFSPQLVSDFGTTIPVKRKHTTFLAVNPHRSAVLSPSSWAVKTESFSLFAENGHLVPFTNNVCVYCTFARRGLCDLHTGCCIHDCDSGHPPCLDGTFRRTHASKCN